MKKTFILSCLFLLCFLQTAKAQSGPNIIWVDPQSSDLLPIDNTTTGNALLNQIFEDFHVESYTFLGNFTWQNKISRPTYEIRIAEEYLGHLPGLCNVLS
jgi:nicotinamide mononucleotide adenylyltransferase